MTTTMVLVLAVIVLVVVGVAKLLTRPRPPVDWTNQGVAEVLENYVDGDPDDDHGQIDFTTFLLLPQKRPEIEQIRLRMAQLHVEFPPARGEVYCSAEGLAVIRDYVRELRGSEA